MHYREELLIGDAESQNGREVYIDIWVIVSHKLGHKQCYILYTPQWHTKYMDLCLLRPSSNQWEITYNNRETLKWNYDLFSWI